MAGKYDSPLKWLLAHFPHVFLQLIGIFTTARIRLLNSEQTVNVASMVDSVLLVEEDSPYAVHFEFDSTRVPNSLRRLLQYNSIASHQHGLPILSVLILLRPEADSPEYTGVYEVWIPGHPEPQVVFRYIVIRIWELDPLLLLENEGTIPLAPVANVAPEDIPALLDKVEEKLATMDRPVMLECLTQMGLLMGLRFDAATVEEMLRRFPAMKESSFYQKILADGEQVGLQKGIKKGEQLGIKKGEQLGQLKAERDAVLRVGRIRLGNPPSDFQERLSTIQEFEELARLLERAAVAGSWVEVFESN